MRAGDQQHVPHPVCICGVHAFVCRADCGSFVLADHDVIQSLLSARRYDKEWERKHGFFTRPLSQMMRKEVAMWAIVQHVLLLQPSCVPVGTILTPRRFFCCVSGKTAPDSRSCTRNSASG